MVKGIGRMSLKPTLVQRITPEFTVFERISVGKTSLSEYGVLSYLVKFGEVSIAYQ